MVLKEAAAMTLLSLLCLSGGSVLMRTSCQKDHKSVHFSLPGYFTTPIHINQCRETVTSTIFPMVSLEPSELLLFRRQFTSCCCAVANTSLHQAEIESVDGRPSIFVQYRRIEDCVCVDCADLDLDRHLIFRQ